MSTFIQFFHRRDDKLVEAIAGCSVVRPDQRFGRRRLNELAREIAKREGYAAFQLRSGRFSNPSNLGPVQELEA